MNSVLSETLIELVSLIAASRRSFSSSDEDDVDGNEDEGGRKRQKKNRSQRLSADQSGHTYSGRRAFSTPTRPRLSLINYPHFIVLTTTSSSSLHFYTIWVNVRLSSTLSVIMSVVSLLNVNIKNNPAPFAAPYEFEITFECLEPLQKGN